MGRFAIQFLSSIVRAAIYSNSLVFLFLPKHSREEGWQLPKKEFVERIEATRLFSYRTKDLVHLQN